MRFKAVGIGTKVVAYRRELNKSNNQLTFYIRNYLMDYYWTIEACVKQWNFLENVLRHNSLLYGGTLSEWQRSLCFVITDEADEILGHF